MSDGQCDEWLSRWEQECSEVVTEAEASLEAQTTTERDANAQRLFLLFQTSATSVAQLYKECQNGVRLWTSFQNAASAVTTLYKECVELQKRQQELSVQFGVHRRNKDVLAWAHKRKRSIRREDLISFLSGRNPRMSPPSQGSRSSGQWGSPRRFDVQRGLTRLSLGAGGTSAESPVAGLTGAASGLVEDDDLGTFRQALAFSAITVGASSGGHHSSPRVSKTAELSHFITEEFARHGRKRPLPVASLHHASHSMPATVVTNSTMQSDDVIHHRSGASIEDDVIMGSPQHKRSKYL
ncbi:UPF0472 protein C16orf72 homolog [Varroa jacobsoni]|uniref:Uncharacterized protein n=1 Tax=Varroa destructor TaxID=109461 RepID=A0A7M7KEK4_VARDE|nr:UPF0472 protein C16orf72 homolog [Varroa destructor]XP_022665629.1 UPF0472 protein C16orf72 homolog [Varroa destructor]XP_022665630.1 UPF0472 protein C16orf72 homolog [Varroa destructor]XP_022703281.1 UPF0472 protein C16orf72 homolog [Varroa jacobsoni]XP_022703290.1 UPF0472 protein C16orf72 homolog [Varroa jacobsoni]XP_022703298.1 UPF0472 protein C16orf72 homolog [Varroa jacobsoni]XP_022703306.1 UPF0472 protein C16orf72 homolog [Varroa jacobsoni]